MKRDAFRDIYCDKFNPDCIVKSSCSILCEEAMKYYFTTTKESHLVSNPEFFSYLKVYEQAKITQLPELIDFAQTLIEEILDKNDM